MLVAFRNYALPWISKVFPDSEKPSSEERTAELLRRELGCLESALDLFFDNSRPPLVDDYRAGLELVEKVWRSIGERRDEMASGIVKIVLERVKAHYACIVKDYDDKYSARNKTQGDEKAVLKEELVSREELTAPGQVPSPQAVQAP